MSDQKPAATWHPHASREEALAAEVREAREQRDTQYRRARELAQLVVDARRQRDALVAELARARGCTENAIRCAHGIT